MDDDETSGSESIAVDSINLSAFNQYSYCPRRCGLIYLEGEFEQNIHTARGNTEHERVDRTAHMVSHDGARVEYALPAWNRRLGLIGRCDVVEFWPDGEIYPVEYKHGPRKRYLNDDLQLAAQTLCLEEMFSQPIPKGAIYHASSRRRREVVIDEPLRRLVVQTADAIRAMLASERLPQPVNDARCRECSLKDLCQPEATAARSRQLRLQAGLFNTDDEAT